MGVELVLVLMFRMVVRLSVNFPGKFGGNPWRALCRVYKILPVTKKCSIEQRILDCNLQ